jgi:hypothetical protein
MSGCHSKSTGNQAVSASDVGSVIQQTLTWTNLRAYVNKKFLDNLSCLPCSAGGCPGPCSEGSQSRGHGGDGIEGSIAADYDFAKAATATSELSGGYTLGHSEHVCDSYTCTGYRSGTCVGTSTCTGYKDKDAGKKTYMTKPDEVLSSPTKTVQVKIPYNYTLKPRTTAGPKAGNGQTYDENLTGGGTWTDSNPKPNYGIAYAGEALSGKATIKINERANTT